MGLLLRALPLLRWPEVACLRDECTYLTLAGRMSAGEGMTVPSELRRWLWAPGYPALISLHDLFGDPQWVRFTQVLLVVPLLLASFSLLRGLHGRRAGLIAAWCLALSPTLVFFSGRLWSETVYVTALLGALATFRWSLSGRGARALIPGLLVGCCVLLRGVAAPLVLLLAGLHALITRRAGGAGALLLGAALSVGPYSAWASSTFGGPVLADRTMGQMMWLGNNTFEPVSFDHGIGPLTPLEWERVVATGRPHCSGELSPTAWDDCERAQGWAFIAQDPARFLRRVPLRLAQWLNPNSFLTRAIRREEWRGLPPWIAEGLCVTTVLWSLIAVVGGSIGLFSRGRGWFASLTVAVVLYHAVAIALVAGLSRYRVPLDVLGLLWAGVWLAELEGSSRTLLGWRGVALAGTLLVVLPLMWRFLLPGFL